jgi:spoIIIJ-associated protein
MNVQTEVDVREDVDEHTRVLLDVSGTDLGILIGRRGDTLSSLQYVVNLIVSRKLKVNARVTVDVEHYRERRYESLRNLALRIADEVKSTDRSISLEPMPSNERRIVHLSLRDYLDVSTQSVGHGEGRKVVISPQNASQLP